MHAAGHDYGAHHHHPTPIANPDPHPPPQDSEASVSSKRQKSRHRASVACATCRERRIRVSAGTTCAQCHSEILCHTPPSRLSPDPELNELQCVVPPGEPECIQCKRTGTECIIKNDDERRRPISRAYMSALTDRVTLLESLLKEKGAEIPSVQYPPKTTRGSLHTDGEHSPVPLPVPKLQSRSSPSPIKPENLSPTSLPDDRAEGSQVSSTGSVENRSEKEGSIGTPIDYKKEGLVSRLLSTRGHLSFDQLSGRLRFYGGTVNCHIYSELEVDDTKDTVEMLEQARRAEKCIRTLPTETYAYLMQLFWQHYNAVLHVVHEEAFNEDLEMGKTQFYSGFLHVCILAMGYRFADKSRADILSITLPNRESTLHREAKYMLEMELERSGGISSIAALLILGDQEVGAGRDNLGWMYSGMAMRLCYDLGLQLDSRNAGLPQRESDIRRMTLWACVIYDRYWSLFLGRPLTMKSVDLEIYSLTAQFERLGTCMPAGPGESLSTKIYETLIELMEIAGKIVEQTGFRGIDELTKDPDQSAYLKMAALDRDLHNWVARLPQDLRYTEENRANAPLSFYLLHQQYHAVLILLHRPFARYDPSTVETEEVSALDSHFSSASRAICTKSAIAMARIFWEHRQKFDGKQIFCTAMQHAGTAATALIAALAYMPDATERNDNIIYLEVLHAALQDMSQIYQPAERMAAVLNAVMTELRGGPISPANSAIPARRGSTLEAESRTTKRRQMSRSNTQAKDMQPPLPPPPPPPPSLPPPPPSSTPARPDGPSNHISEPNFTPSQPLQQPPSDYVMVSPQVDLPPWPMAYDQQSLTQHGHTVLQNAQGDPSIGRSGWTTSQMQSSDFTQGSMMTDIPGFPEGSMSDLDYYHNFPSEEDWTRWHTNSAIDLATNTGANGQAPRGRPANYHSPPMGGVRRG